MTPLLSPHSHQATRETCSERYGDYDSKESEKCDGNFSVSEFFTPFIGIYLLCVK
jgi:hypothetical protein